MYLSKKPEKYIIPEYSLTGDLLAYLTCGLQYRYHNKGQLPPSTPVQLWFGEFIHGVMEEAFERWKQNNVLKRFPWTWEPDIRDIELEIDRRLKVKGLFPPPPLFCPYTSAMATPGICKKKNHPHRKIASRRAIASINTWGPHLFPLIDESEVKLKGIREMPSSPSGLSRSDYYGITGVIDVISSFNISTCGKDNQIIRHFRNNPEVKAIMDNLGSNEYEVIIDYKGMRRPPTIPNSAWSHHEWQIRTYAWLRSLDPQSKPVIAGILFYLNELEPSLSDFHSLLEDSQKNQTDIMPISLDKQAINKWKHGSSLPVLSQQFRENRSIRVVACGNPLINNSLAEFDKVVRNIEDCVISEINGSSITSSWTPFPVKRTCTACDFKTYCPNPAPSRYFPTAP